MHVRYHPPEICSSPWIVNDPLLSAGQESLEAYYSSLWSQPALLKAAGGFPAIASREAPRDGTPVLHLVPLLGTKAEWSAPALQPGDRIFFDGLVPELISQNGNAFHAFPEYTTITALKERLRTPVGEFLIPENLSLGVWTSIPEGWTGAGDRDGDPFYLFSRERFLSPVNSGCVDLLLRRDKGRRAWNWRAFLAASLSRWLAGGAGERLVVEPSRERDLSDAFSAFGFHRWLVLRTAGELDADLNLSRAEAAAMEAVEAFHCQRWDETERRLQAGFDELKGHLDQLTGTTRRYFCEAQHGGMLHEDIGFFEHDWPQMVCDTLREYLAYEGAVVSLDMPANLFRHYRDRFPAFFRELCQWMEQGRVELLNGMFGQPFSDTQSLENLLSQFIEGRRELESLFGMKPGIFAMEEYSLGPAMPQILQASGISQAVHAVRLGGTSKKNSPAVRSWRGLGNGSVEAIEHPDVGESGLSTGYFLKLPGAFAQAGRLQREVVTLFNIPDFGWNVLFREEVFTALRFGPVLFRMATFQELFDLLPRAADEVSGAWEDSYHTIFNQYTIRGNMRRYHEQLRRFEVFLIAGEIEACFSGKSEGGFKGAWQDYLLGSSHDYTLVGGGLNGWYGSATRAGYRGPIQISFQRTLESVMSAKLETWSQRLAESLSIDPAGPYLTNPHGFPVPLRTPDGQCGGCGAVLEPFSSLKVPAKTPPSPVASKDAAVDAAVLDNGRVRCSIDRETGAIGSARWQGRTLWDGNRLGIGFSGKTIRLVDGELHHAVESAEGRAVTHRGRLADQNGQTLGWIETAYLLKAGTDDLLVELVLCPALLPPRGDFDWQKEWDGTFRYLLPRPGRSPEIWVCQANALLKVSPGRRDPGAAERSVPDARAHVTSPEVLGDETQEGDPVWYYNAGFPSYLVYEDRVEQFIRMPGEEHLRLRFGLGFGNGSHSPVQRSRMLLHPAFHTRAPMPPLPLKWENARIGLLRVDPEENGGGCKLWFWNYSDREEAFAPEMAPGYELCGISSAKGNLHPVSAGGDWIAGPYSLFHLQLSRVRLRENPLPEHSPSPQVCVPA